MQTGKNIGCHLPAGYAGKKVDFPGAPVYLEVAGFPAERIEQQ